MRILIVDNYDSFTFNLFQLAARVSGSEPLVVRNDRSSWAELEALGADGVIVSPGPGRPDEAADFGVSAHVLEHARVPVLGVCLGHQGIALAFGGEVTHAPEPMHGRASSIHHAGGGLFEGMPQGFEAARYHSLVVREPLPASLEAVAWTSDGVLMGLRHRARPLWGVQFHPESIATELGDKLMANFLAMAQANASSAWAPSTRAIAVVPRANAALPKRAVEHRVLARELPPLTDPDEAFLALFAQDPTAVWLDSSRAETGLSRFTFMGAPIGPLGQEIRYRVEDQTLAITQGGRTTMRRGSVFDWLDQELRGHRVTAGDLPFDFTCGFVGYLGYELKAECGGGRRHRARHPDAHFVLADRLVVFDHEAGSLWLVALADDTPESEDLALRWFDDAEQRLRGCQGAPTPERSPQRGAIELRWSRPRQRYLEDLATCLRHIRDGQSYEICLTNTLHVKTSTDPLAYYQHLRRTNAAPHSAFLRFGDVAIACSSPERFLRIDVAGNVEAKPIKGTAQRGASAEEDARIAEALATSEKARSENLMITDLLRNDLGVVCEIGSVHVPRLMAVETYATVHQLVSTVRGRLRRGLSPVACVRACFPGGSMTGAPKVRTMEILDALEGEARGIYSGAIGYFSLTGAVDLNIVIRSAVFDSNGVGIGVGGAVVALSDVDAEYDEAILKARALVRALLLANGEPNVDERLASLEASLRR